MCAEHPQHDAHEGGASHDDANHELVARDDASAGLMARLGIKLVRGYQLYISPMTPPTCRFQPSCSQYTLIAIRRYGLIKGSWMGAMRILRCNPFHPGGVDPVP